MSVVTNIMLQFEGATRDFEDESWTDSDHDKVALVDEITTRLCDCW